MSTKPNQHATATKLFFDCGHAELKPLNAVEYRHVSVGGPCAACRGESPSMTDEKIMDLLEMDREEFDDFYLEILTLVRREGTLGVQTMLNYVEQELTAGRENIE